MWSGRKKQEQFNIDFNTGLDDIVEGDMKRSRTVGTTKLIDSDILKSVVKKSIVMSDFESLLFADESRFCEVNWLDLLEDYSSKHLRWSGELETECNSYQSGSDGQTSTSKTTRSTITLDYFMSCSESILNLDADDLSLDPRMYLSQFSVCEGFEIRSNSEVRSVEYIEKRNSMSFPVSVSEIEKVESLSFGRSSTENCVFLNGEAVSECVLRHKDERVKGQRSYRSNIEPIKAYIHEYDLFFDELGINENSYRASGSFNLNNWQGSYDRSYSGLTKMKLQSDQIGKVSLELEGAK